MDDKDTFIISGTGTDCLTVTDSVTLDLDFGGAQGAIDTITLDDINMNSTITLPSTSYTVAGGGGGSGGYISTNSYTWSQNYPATVQIDNAGMNIKEGGDIKLGNVSLKDFITKMEQRLAILVPDPEKLEKFEALKKAYEHYKTMESLCFPEEKEEKE
jgi:hypothetical protein